MDFALTGPASDIGQAEVLGELTPLALHRARRGFVKAYTAQASQIRRLLAEYGIIIPQGIGHIAWRLPKILEDGENELPRVFRQLLQRLGEPLKALDR